MSLNQKKISGFAALAATRAPFQNKKRLCVMSGVLKSDLDHKNIDLLKKFVSPCGRILPTRLSGLCASHQRLAARAIKRARFLALLPYC